MPESGRSFSNLVNSGIYCVDAHVLKRIPSGRPVDWSHDIFPELLAEQPSLYGHELHGYWRDVGSIPEYLQGQRDVLAGALRDSVPGIELRSHLWVGSNSHIAPGAVVKGPVLVGPGCWIEREACLLPGTVLGAGTRIGRGACIEGAVLGADCVVGPGAVLRDCVIDDGVRIGGGCRVDGGGVLGCGCRLAAGTAVGSGSRIAPGEALPARRVGRGREAPAAAVAVA